MDSIQTKIEAIKADKNNLKTACVAPGSLCNIKVSEGRVIIANQYKMSPLEVTDVMKVDREVPKATYCIAIPDNIPPYMLGREVVLDMSYKNLDKKLIDVLGGNDNFRVVENRPGLKDRSKLIVGEDGKVEFWECNLISLNQIGGVIY